MSHIRSWIKLLDQSENEFPQNKDREDSKLVDQIHVNPICFKIKFKILLLSLNSIPLSFILLWTFFTVSFICDYQWNNSWFVYEVSIKIIKSTFCAFLGLVFCGVSNDQLPLSETASNSFHMLYYVILKIPIASNLLSFTLFKGILIPALASHSKNFVARSTVSLA